MLYVENKGRYLEAFGEPSVKIHSGGIFMAEISNMQLPTIGPSSFTYLRGQICENGQEKKYVAVNKPTHPQISEC